MQVWSLGFHVVSKRHYATTEIMDRKSCHFLEIELEFEDTHESLNCFMAGVRSVGLIGAVG